MIRSTNIVAIASAYGYAGIGIVRVSGYGLLAIAQTLSKRMEFKPRYAYYNNLYDLNDEIIDNGIILYFNSPDSFTGEEVLEFQIHGSPICLQLLVQRLQQCGCSLAAPGEFSQRAYHNNKIDLLQAESIIDLIHAQSEAAAKSAVRSLQGKFSQQINQINQQLIELRMFIEATLDFPEEELEFIIDAKIKSRLTQLRTDLQQLLNNTHNGTMLNNGLNVVIIGSPNVGKSSLLNALTQENTAIVSEIAGTTRDIISQSLNLNGVPLHIIDTAGIRASQDPIESLGIIKAKETILKADVILLLLDLTNLTPTQDLFALIPQNNKYIVIYNKIDAIGKSALQIDTDHGVEVYLSAKTGAGIEILKQVILNLVGFNPYDENTFIARTRHLEAIKIALEHTDRAFLNWINLEILAQEMRYAHQKLSEITGKYSSDDLLGEIFSRFCIGK